MMSVLRSNPLAAFLALLLHVVLIVLLLFGNSPEPASKPVVAKSEPIQATVVDAKQLNAKAEKEKQAEAKRKRLAAERKKRLAEQKKKQAAEKKRLTEQKKKRVAEAKRKKVEKKRQADLKKKREADKKRKVEQKRKAEQKTKADRKAKAVAEVKRKKAAETKRKAEVKRKAEAAAKRKADAKRKAEIAAKLKAAEDARKKAAVAQKARENALLLQMNAERDARERDRYVIAITQRIEGGWLRPPNTGEGLSCLIKVRLIPGGDVVPGSVIVIRSSGNPVFDRSVESAIYKAAPLPVPSGRLFETFRDVQFEFKPGT
ncbi:MAG: cell envelope integrity protein TolA [Candidatus Polarisedimenticolaceae bacterium]|nr:cell envelope integrity protein TolA [Candidatus Polarisedimenticolaceae bacterium]